MNKLLTISIIANLAMASTAFAGGSPKPDPSTIDCYPTVEPQDMTEKGWKRLKSFERLSASQDAAAGKIKLQRFETLTCIAYHSGDATEFTAAEWWWRKVDKQRKRAQVARKAIR